MHNINNKKRILELEIVKYFHKINHRKLIELIRLFNIEVKDSKISIKSKEY